MMDNETKEFYVGASVDDLPGVVWFKAPKASGSLLGLPAGTWFNLDDIGDNEKTIFDPNLECGNYRRGGTYGRLRTYDVSYDLEGR